ncbi:hypothetical protein [Sorangium sp. So ce1389]|uniref:hypothetical protein n=1 Tax=Sorangium sp. So ce1389 TaxID=3133336 RepID=UPI003F61FB97
MLRDNSGWTFLPIVQRSREHPWRRRDLFKLLQQPVVRPDPELLYRDPRAYYDKKISVVGRIYSSFEYTHLVIEGCPQQMDVWPAWGSPYGTLLKRAGVDPDEWPQHTPTPSDAWYLRGRRAGPMREFVDYLEVDGAYGHESMWHHQMMITEIYPHPCTEAERAAVRERYLASFESEHVSTRPSAR